MTRERRTPHAGACYATSYSFIALEGRSRIAVSIDRGAAPQLKSDEFLDLPLLLHELGPFFS